MGLPYVAVRNVIAILYCLEWRFASEIILDYPLPMGRIDRVFNSADLLKPFLPFLLDQITRLLPQVCCSGLCSFGKSENLILQREAAQFIRRTSELLEELAGLLLLLGEKLVFHHEGDVELSLAGLAQPYECAERTRVAAGVAAGEGGSQAEEGHAQERT